MAIKNYLLGRDAKLFAGEAGSTPTTEIKDVKDLSITLTQGEIDVTTRTAQGWKATAPGLREAEISFDLLCGVGSNEAAIFLNAYNGTNGGYVAIKIVDKSTDGLVTFEADCMIADCSMEQNLEDSIKLSVKAKPTVYDDTRPPTLSIAA
jgi:hypothetical protein